ncbi:carboxylesterase/lipase family protein [Actinomadura rudentiformis]|uniref:Carboxylic ester hydrolase n=1 Tax=Actinomadura rudentiformis TaxID=359158 RepID=A0A6H9YV64_9ACTN|nr:carboxylesterase family protein [Actinomadura rudentiformis]KAB2348485.1 carboxylesterase family protein [Actinomadura rudentiformis]
MSKKARCATAATVAVAATLGGTVAAGSATAAPADPTRVTTVEGPVRGAISGDVRTFQGIPYASPPVDDLRWKSPRPVTPWSAPLDARQPRSACPQPSDQPIAVPGTNGEDCLYLNVTTPAKAAKRLPVIVWIHGGSFVYGDGATYKAAKLATRGKAVVVTINYRLGAFGFLSHPGLRAPANLGLQDQQAALRWVRRNAAAFGGDARNVTIMGQSGGGYSVCAQLASPGARGLFAKAIVQSAGCAGKDGSMSVKQAHDNGIATAKALRCDDVAGADACLRRAKTGDLVKATAAGHEGYRPVVDGTVLPLAPARALATGRFHRVPVLHGSTHDEMSGLVGAEEAMTGKPLTAEGYAAKVEKAFGADAAAVLSEYPAGSHGSPGATLAAVLTDSEWSTAALDTQRALARHVPVYAYDFADADAPYFKGFPRPKSFSLGTGHMIDLAYLFENDLFEPLNERQAGLSDTVISYWSRFAHTGRPGGHGTPAWQRFTPRDAYVQKLASGKDGIGRTDFAADHHYTFWKSLQR